MLKRQRTHQHLEQRPSKLPDELRDVVQLERCSNRAEVARASRGAHAL